MDAKEKAALRAGCTRFLSGHGPSSAGAWVDRLARSPNLHHALDVYSEGPAIELLEQRAAALLGKPAALWFPKGITAQQAALLVHAAEMRSRVVALHPKSHLALDETDALDRLAGLLPRRIGADHRPFTLAELEQVNEPLAAVTVEIPLRRAAFQAPSWDELAGMAAWARERKIPFHLDAARLWEVQPWYNRPLAEIAALSDSIYVSFYKGLNGMGGCVLAGSPQFIAAAKPWRNRYGGDLATSFPFIVTALDGLDTHLPRMAAYHHRAVALAQRIDALEGVSALPHLPHGNSFQVHFAAPIGGLERAVLDLARREGIWLLNRLGEGLAPDIAYGEIAVGEATLGWDIDEAVEKIRALQAAAASPTR